MPAFQRLEHLPILAEIHVVGNLGGVIDVHDVHGVLLVAVVARIASCSAVILRRERISREPRRMLVWHCPFQSSFEARCRLRLRMTSVFLTPASYRTAASHRCRSA